MPQPNTRHAWWKDLVFLTLALGVLYFVLLGVRPLFVPDEGRYAEIAREMVVSGDYLTPHLNAIKYFEKPVLFYWLGAGAIQVLGLSIWSLRSLNAVIGLLGCLLTYVAGRKLYDRNTGIAAALILGTSALYFVMSHTVSLDLPVTVFIAGTLFGFLLGIQHPPGSTRRWSMWGAAVSAALAVLTKGLIGLVFPALIIGSWIALMGEWRLLKHIYLPSSLLIFLLIAAPWHILVGLQNPEFFYFYFIKQHFLRYTLLKIGHYQPVWYFIPIIFLGFFPWIVFLPQTLAQCWPASWSERKALKTEWFLLLWAALIFAFFSFSKSKLIPYILPVFPPLALLTARLLTQTTRTRALKLSYTALSLCADLLLIGFLIFPQRTPLTDARTATGLLFIAGLVLIVGYSFARINVTQNARKSFFAVIITTSLFLLIGLAAIPSIDTRTIKPLAAQLKPLLKPGDEVVCYNQYYQDLPFYLQQRVSVLNWQNELGYGMQHQDTQAWMITTPTFWRWWHRPQQRVFAMMGQEEFAEFKKKYAHEGYFVIGQTLNNVLISNQP